MYILVSGTITITEARADDGGKRFDEKNKGIIFSLGTIHWLNKWNKQHSNR